MNGKNFTAHYGGSSRKASSGLMSLGWNNYHRPTQEMVGNKTMLII
jgi:hypothetical protein